MLIHCTKKLLDELKIAPAAPAVDYDPLFTWRANVIMLNRRKTVVLMCELNRYIVVLHGLKAKDFKELGKHIIEAIRFALSNEQINPDVIERYLAEAGDPVFAQKVDRAQTARMNKACEAVQIFAEDQQTIDPAILGMKANRFLVGNADQDYFYPSEKMIEDLKRFGIEPMFRCHAFELAVRLELEGQDAVRKLIVPAGITFEQLHLILQASFNWYNYHLYDFGLLKQKGQAEPDIELVMSEEDLEDSNGHAQLMQGVKLSDYLSQYKYMLYHYDFGDGWCHHIEVTHEYERYAELLPLLIAGEGNAPPEDVGGVAGFEHFLEVMSNPSHRDYSYLKEWSQDQGYSEFNLEKAKLQVKNALRW